MQLHRNDVEERRSPSMGVSSRSHSGSIEQKIVSKSLIFLLVFAISFRLFDTLKLHTSSIVGIYMKFQIFFFYLSHSDG